MTTMIRPLEGPNAAAVGETIREILSDISLSMGEKLLLIEGLFVQDTTPELQTGRSDGTSLNAPDQLFP